jgi:2-keto-4-pentenoate hydratase
MNLKKKLTPNEVLKAVLYFIVNTEIPEGRSNDIEVSAYFTEDDDGSVEVSILEAKKNMSREVVSTVDPKDFN